MAAKATEKTLKWEKADVLIVGQDPDPQAYHALVYGRLAVVNTGGRLRSKYGLYHVPTGLGYGRWWKKLRDTKAAAERLLAEHPEWVEFDREQPDWSQWGWMAVPNYLGKLGGER